jgi:hypothetical protein
MKRFIVSILGVSFFFICMGAVVDHVGAKFKSDEKALDIIKKARAAIGGDAALAGVRGLVIKGQTRRTFQIDGAERLEQGETEIALQYPDRMYKMVKLGKHDGAEGEGLIEKRFDVVVTGKGEGHTVVLEGEGGEFTGPEGKKIIVRKAEGGKGGWKTESGVVNELNSADGKKIVRKSANGNATFTSEDGKTIEKMHSGEPQGAMRQNELLRTTLSLLLTAPEGMDVSYTFAGEGDVEGTTVNAVVASFGEASYKLYFDRSSNLPVAMSYSGHPMPHIVKFKREGNPTAGGEPATDMMVFTRKIEGPGEMIENFVRFSDYRGTNGVQLPYKWTTTVGGKTSEVFDVTSYEVNPANIADRFKGEKVFVRSAKPVQN